MKYLDKEKCKPYIASQILSPMFLSERMSHLEGKSLGNLSGLVHLLLLFSTGALHWIFFFFFLPPPFPTPRDLMLKALLCFLNSNHLRFCFGPALNSISPGPTESEPYFIKIPRSCICVLKFEKHWLKTHNLVSLCLMVSVQSFKLHIKKFVVIQ